ncbi:hypothetical protein FB451DRAFT_1495534 [Mycena latifolia]|nr:hypothetical protein FB451DRAFT_1495534 [Mycena latifolia]
MRRSEAQCEPSQTLKIAQLARTKGKNNLNEVHDKIDLLTRGASEAAQRVAPHPDTLSQADQLAPQDHFVDKDTSSEDDDDDEEGVEKKGASLLTVPAAHYWYDIYAEKKKEEQSLMACMRGAHQDKLDAGKAWADDYFPAERREQWIWRGKKARSSCYRVSTLCRGWRRWAGCWTPSPRGRCARREAGVGAHSQASGIAEHPALHLLRTLLERFANGASLQPVFDAAAVLTRGLRTWWEEVLLQAGYIIEPACTSRAQELQDQGHAFYQDKYKAHFDNLFDAASTWVKSIAADPLNTRFGADWARPTRDLLSDGEGNLQFKKTLWEDVRVVILPALIDHWVTCPSRASSTRTPRSTSSSRTLRSRGATNLLPNVVELKAHNYVRFGPYAPPGLGAGDAARHEVTSTFAQIQADMRGVAFLVPHHVGTADERRGARGRGARRAGCHGACPAPDKTSVFPVPRARVTVGALRFHIRDSKRDLFICCTRNALADAIRTGFEHVDGRLAGVRARGGIFKRKDDASSAVETVQWRAAVKSNIKRVRQ